VKLKAVYGFKDILPDESPRWQRLEARARTVFRCFGFQEIRVPIIESTELFARSIGEATDIVEKEMYTFADKGLTLRPEATASLLRAFIEHGLHVQQPVQRLFTIGPMFRHERPQKGRYRQFHQIDAEVIGASEASVDAELIALAQMLLDQLGLHVSLEINSIGCPECRPDFRQKLTQYLQTCHAELCEDCRRRSLTNPLRTLDCKQTTCRRLVQEAPSLVESLCAACAEHFTALRQGLDAFGIAYNVNRFMVRGLDYYTRTTFEFITADLGAQAAVAAGGRYDGLIEQLGGPAKMPGIGFALGMERLILLMEQQEASTEAEDRADLFAVTLGERAITFAIPLVHALRHRGHWIALDHSQRSLKAQMKQADRVKARFALIIGEQELEQGEAVLRNMDNQEQGRFSLQGTAEELAERLARLLAGDKN
jgi:histidyl-tRNA synthetase